MKFKHYWELLKFIEENGKVSPTIWGKGEYIYSNNGTLLDEDGIHYELYEFGLDIDWGIHQESLKPFDCVMCWDDEGEQSKRYGVFKNYSFNEGKCLFDISGNNFIFKHAEKIPENEIPKWLKDVRERIMKEQDK